jgi:hypothetical protein
MDYRGVELGCQEQNRPACTICNADTTTADFEGCKLWDDACATSTACTNDYEVYAPAQTAATVTAGCVDLKTASLSTEIIVVDTTGQDAAGAETMRLVLITPLACTGTEFYSINHERCMTGTAVGNCYLKNGANCDNCESGYYTKSDGTCGPLAVPGDAAGAIFSGDTFVAACPTGSTEATELLYASEILPYITVTAPSFAASSWRMSVTTINLTVSTCKCKANEGYLWNSSTNTCEQQALTCSASCTTTVPASPTTSDDCICTQCPSTHAHVVGSPNECLVLPSACDGSAATCAGTTDANITFTLVNGKYYADCAADKVAKDGACVCKYGPAADSTCVT